MTTQSLSYDALRDSLISYVKGTNEFRDYNFAASGISTLINILAFNTHTIGYYVKMLLNERFVDSARLRESMLSIAKQVGYTPRGVRSATAELFVKVALSVDPEDFEVTIPRGSKFSSITNSGVKRTFVTVDDFSLYNREVSGSEVIYKNTIDPITPLVVKEGEFQIWKFEADNSVVNQRFVIQQTGVDFDTIRVKVYDSKGSVSFKHFTLATYETMIQPESYVFYITTNENGYYEILFGDGVFGRKLENGNIIEASYVVTSGENGNGAGILGTWSSETSITGRPIQIDLNPYTGYSTDIGKPIASGGTPEETVESMRFTIPHHFRRQNRIVTADDYRTIILGEYRNIDSINVWGGENAYRKEFGKVFISIKPKNAQKLSDVSKESIRKTLITKFGMIGIDPIFIDPDFVYVELDVKALFDKTKTNMSKGEISTEIFNSIDTYAAEKLNTFDSMYSEVDILDYIREKIPSLKTLYTFKKLRKDVKVKYLNQPQLEIILGNEIKKGSVYSSEIIYGGVASIIIDVDGKLYLVKSSDHATKVIPQIVGTVDYSMGVFSLILPKAFSMAGENDKGTYGILKLYSDPVSPDINTYMNNIVTISNTKVTVNG